MAAEVGNGSALHLLIPLSGRSGACPAHWAVLSMELGKAQGRQCCHQQQQCLRAPVPSSPRRSAILLPRVSVSAEPERPPARPRPRCCTEVTLQTLALHHGFYYPRSTAGPLHRGKDRGSERAADQPKVTE